MMFQAQEIKLLKRNLMYQLEQHKVHLLLKMNLMNQLEQHKVHSQFKKVKPINLRIVLKHCLLKSTKKVDAKKKKTTEDDNEIVIKGLMEVMKQFTESHDKRMDSLIDKLGERDLSDICGKIFSIIGSPAFEIYNSDKQVKAAMEIT
uniref:RNase H family protein n=1 Tax=Solanum tuberosum TaxID=4113 RepID=M1CSC1_SOLTU